MGKVVTVTANPSLDKTVTVARLIPYGLNRVTEARLDPGGKGISVARVLNRFGVETVATGFLAGATGRRLAASAEAEGLACNFLEIPGETRTNLKLFDSEAKKITEVNESGCPVLPRDLERFEEKIRSLCREAEIVVLGGSLPPGVPDDFYARCIGWAKRSGAKVLLDAEGPALRAGLSAAPYAVKPNRHELEGFIGKPLPDTHAVLAAARRLISSGIQAVIVSMGADGALAVDAKKAYRTRPWPIDAQSATGAGDSMVALFAYAILEGLPLDDTARITTAAGTVTASKPGTELCSKEEVLAAVPRVSLTEISDE